MQRTQLPEGRDSLEKFLASDLSTRGLLSRICLKKIKKLTQKDYLQIKIMEEDARWSPQIQNRIVSKT